MLPSESFLVRPRATTSSSSVLEGAAAMAGVGMLVGLLGMAVVL